MPKSEYGAQPWERQPGESAPAYEAFSLYRDMGLERSLRAVAGKLGKSRALIERWSAAKNWGERTRLYDNSLQREAYKKAVKGVEEMQTRQIKLGVLMQKKAAEALDKIPVELMSPMEIARLIKEGSQLERQNRILDPAIAGEQHAQEREDEHEANADASPVSVLSNLTDEELSQLERIVGKLATVDSE